MDAFGHRISTFATSVNLIARSTFVAFQTYQETMSIFKSIFRGLDFDPVLT